MTCTCGSRGSVQTARVSETPEIWIAFCLTCVGVGVTESEARTEWETGFARTLESEERCAS